ncbi:NAD(P)-dependent dehydrogenase, short-chain alcohol dehydrogenase family [Lentzea fradiae]|uniref:NAD(P)-dependent dehydrogenase, short-chain alcohol dehydrogenase family n=1 Tax=Lentzea fradiae TaxID=200378 RepID=A0A1G8CXR0_9PSEU|nr:oxidoreductase [Lentzea fradiae]SDH50367.1 NAD(P)-dependent dehydrogenase, short-chain alcohol dehydrogenase family [Lentzea fradiae]
MSRWTEADIPDQTGRTVLVTGANSGLGLRTAQVLASKGAHVLMGCRSVQRGQEARRSVTGSAEVLELDLADLGSVRSAAGQVTELDVLVNNAGIMAVPNGRTADGFERQFGTNHLGHAALTFLLLPVLRQSSNARVVTVSSLMHRRGRMNFDDLNWERRPYNAWDAYGQSKLANILFARELDRRSPDVTSVAAHPGVTATELTTNMASAHNSSVMRIGGKVTHLFSQSAEMGALPQLYAAISPDVRGGQYYGPGGFNGLRGHPAVARMSAAARDDLAATRLWDLTTKLTGITPDLP